MVICPVVAEIFQSVVDRLADRHCTHQFDIKSKQKKLQYLYSTNGQIPF